MDLLGQGLKRIRTPVQQGRIIACHPGDVRLRVLDGTEQRQIRVGACDQLFHTLLHTLHRIRGGHGNRRPTDDQLSVADGLLDACGQLLASFAVLPLLGIENMALRIGQ